MEVGNILKMCNEIKQRAWDIREFIDNEELDCLNFRFLELTSYDYFQLDEDNIGDVRIKFAERYYSDMSDDISSLPLNLFEADNWKELLIKENEIGLAKRIQFEESVREATKKREYNEYLKLKEKFEGDK